MRSHRFQRWLAVGAMLALPVMVYAQEATLSGTVSDTTGGALPGVTVRAVHEASGNSFEGVTDERGSFRLSVRVGTYRVTAELSGFAPITRSVTLLVGQQAVVNLQMAVSGVQESVTVTGEAPLLDVTQSSLGGNIDPRQMQELPVNGRNWMDLLVLAPGSRGNAMISDNPGSLRVGTSAGGGDFELNIDGQQVTQLLTPSANEAQPRFSREAIAEFEFVSSRFDATQGRSSGLQVNAITKSGTNTPSGSFSGYFRDERFNAADFVAKRVLPYEDQQVVGTFGGPILKDKIHFFAHYEYEREPRTQFYTTPFPHFNVDLNSLHTEKKGGVKLDTQFSPEARLAVRWSGWRQVDPIIGAGGGGGGGTTTPSSHRTINRKTDQVFAALTQVLSNRAVNDLKLGYAHFFTHDAEAAKNPNARFNGLNGPVVLLRGLAAGGIAQFPSDTSQNVYSIRDDFTYSFRKGGRHTVKLGAEYLYTKAVDFRCNLCEGELTANVAPIPANVESLFPNLFDVSTWNLAPLSPITIRFRQDFGDSFSVPVPRHSSAVWLQDDWSVTPRLTLNLGVRYDLEINAFANNEAILPMRPAGQPNDTNNVAPRVGFNFSANDRTVIRGGAGLYYATVLTAYTTRSVARNITLVTFNDGRSDFASNPYDGPAPSYESLLARVCTAALAPGCVRREYSTSFATVFAPGFTMPYSYQSSIGLQRQLGTTIAFEADYVYNGTRDVPSPAVNNLTYNPATGAPYPFSDLSRRVWPEWGFVKLFFNGSRTNMHTLQTALTKRFSRGWQASGTYTLSGIKDASAPPRSGLDLVPFPTAPDLGGEYTVAAGDQRHRAVFNGIWQLRYGFQVSGLYFFGSGEHYDTRYGVDLRQLGTNGTGNESRWRPDGSIVPRNSFVGEPVHRVDLRVQRRFPLGGRAGIDGIVEVFNVFNHANYGSYVTQESSSNFRQPSQNTALAFAPRMLQLGFRLAF